LIGGGGHSGGGGGGICFARGKKYSWVGKTAGGVKRLPEGKKKYLETRCKMFSFIGESMKAGGRNTKGKGRRKGI